MLNFILLGLLVVSLLAISGCVDKTAEQAVEPAENVQTYVIGTEPYFPPFEYADENSSSTIIGFDVDLINAIAEDQGFKVQWKDLEFDAL
ncbi:MAG TPA: transporter substrate-binding domain-containing protein, partial [Methanomethylovorans sp.]|nr:transporter substrate-binding domain-containing protein [Methanomethylovorans sp.]